jgi:hypothetical protein
VRPVDNFKIIFYDENEKDALRRPNCELWGDNKYK